MYVAYIFLKTGIICISRKRSLAHRLLRRTFLILHRFRRSPAPRSVKDSTRSGSSLAPWCLPEVCFLHIQLLSTTAEAGATMWFFSQQQQHGYTVNNHIQHVPAGCHFFKGLGGGGRRGGGSGASTTFFFKFLLLLLLLHPFSAYLLRSAYSLLNFAFC